LPIFSYNGSVQEAAWDAEFAANRNKNRNGKFADVNFFGEYNGPTYTEGSGPFQFEHSERGGKYYINADIGAALGFGGSVGGEIFFDTKSWTIGIKGRGSGHLGLSAKAKGGLGYVTTDGETVLSNFKVKGDITTDIGGNVGFNLGPAEVRAVALLKTEWVDVTGSAIRNADGSHWASDDIRTGNNHFEVTTTGGAKASVNSTDQLTFGSIVTRQSEDVKLQLGAQAKIVGGRQSFDVMIDPKLQVSANGRFTGQFSFKQVANSAIRIGYNALDSLTSPHSYSIG